MENDRWRWVAILAPHILIASTGTATAYRAAPASTVATVDLAHVGSAPIRGIPFSGELPDPVARVRLGTSVVAVILALRR